jgi:D-alanyl-D-alanine carboxypeptidase/D-alanyl-D-alanine-endopeptidase (penicillin-binding protein 4)
MAAAGVKRIEGDLIADESYFKGNAIPGTWENDDLMWYYGAEISALPVNDNAVDVSIKPGPVGYGCTVVVSPLNPVLRVNNRCSTASAGSQRTLTVNRPVGQNVLDITGTLPAGDNAFSESISVSHPAELFVALLKQRLQEKGVTVTGQAQVQSPADSSPPPAARSLPMGSLTAAPATAPVEIARLESPPFSVVAAKTMKPSQNLYTETILWTLGEQLREQDQKDSMVRGSAPVYGRMDSADIGLAATRAFRTQIGIPADAVVQYDGSGLSRHDLITPAAVVQLYTYMAKQSRFAQAWKDSLTIAGVDGTLRNRFKGTAASGNVRGKTGTIDQVSALSGYMTTAAGEPLVFSIIVNGVPEGRNRTAPMDEIVVSLANFNGKIDQ